jgi:hypothetical protein
MTWPRGLSPKARTSSSMASCFGKTGGRRSRPRLLLLRRRGPDPINQRRNTRALILPCYNPLWR